MSTPEAQEIPEEYANFDFAIMAIFATYLFEVSTAIGEQRQKLLKSDFWSKDENRLNQAQKEVRKASIQSVTLCLVLIIATAIGISLPTTALDVRMIWILEGLSLLFAAVLLARLSFQLGQWAGVYFRIWQDHEEESSRTFKELKFNVRWMYYRLFFRFFFFLMPFYLGVSALSIPLSMLAGIGGGFFADAGVFLARRNEKYKVPIVFCFAVVVVFGSSWLLAGGIFFIAKVWGTYDNPSRDVWLSSAFATCFCVEALLHIFRWWKSRKKFKEVDESAISCKSIQNRPRMATSLIIEAVEKRTSRDEDASGACEAQTEHETEYSSGKLESDGTEAATEQERAVSKEPNADTPDVEAGREELITDKASDASPEASALDSDEVEVQIESEEEDEEEHSLEDEEEYPVPSYKQLFCAYWQCCGCVRGDDRSKKEKAWSFLYWVAWFFLAALSLYLVAVNIGATAQQNHARQKLPFVENALYDYMDEGPVCAFDNKGADSNITTFPNKEAAHAERFLVLHCGECAACSDWENLRQEYVTRDFLAKESARCAKKSLFGGRQAVLDCLKLPPISFQGKCAECWVDDILCTKDFCALIFLQSVIINTAGNFQVGEDTITSAACEEAHCEAGNPGDFVYCSGATRRRMNVTSTIQRPGAQRCGIVDVDWAELFPEDA